MPEDLPIATFVTLIVTVLVSLRGFKDEVLREKLIFDPRPILAFKEYYRLMSSALLHADVNHLFGNMFSLFFFGRMLEINLGMDVFLVIYVGSVLGGSLLSLWLHRHHDYRALGASGGVCGVLFAFVAIWPHAGVTLFLLPIPIPGWLFAIGYLAFSFVGVQRGWGNIGHDAHLGGAGVGLVLAAVLMPHAVFANPLMFLVLLAIAAGMVLYLWLNPLLLPLKFSRRGRDTRQPAKPSEDSSPREADVDAVLEKVSRDGINSLTAKERRILESAAKK